jgi:Outer membrane protein beta-barrel domain
MKTKFLAITTILIFLTIAMQAQIGFGILAGVNFQNINGKDNGGTKLENGLLTGFHAGVNVNIPLAGDFYFQPGLLFSVKGAKNDFFSPQTKASGNFETTTKLNYIEMPLNLLYRPRLGKGCLLLGFGPYIAYGLGGSENSELLGLVSYERSVKYKNKVTNVTELLENAYYRPIDAGANIFFGYELALGVFIQLNAQLGLLKINPEYAWESESKASYKNTGYGLSVGYRF